MNPPCFGITKRLLRYSEIEKQTKIYMMEVNCLWTVLCILQIDLIDYTYMPTFNFQSLMRDMVTSQ